ncbi:hypothetical protein CUMW_137800 [Citrus unshiu]|uniref:Uncharacterized protein n=1 Tax=Citrus unshiu TaxID=55188 RepID=A0A2H5PHS7_CITUN|nr:hypothetical protein CUMW_137800 [Citrus unshiu]
MEGCKNSSNPPKPKEFFLRIQIALFVAQNQCSSAPKCPLCRKMKNFKWVKFTFSCTIKVCTATLTLQELCSLAIKASSAISHATGKNGLKYPAATSNGFCEVPIEFQAPARQNDRRIEY